MAQKLSKHELVERLILLKEKQERLVKQVGDLTQEIHELTLPFLPHKPKPSPLITTSLVAKVLREKNDWLDCAEITESVLKLQGQWQDVNVGDKNYRVTKRILLRFMKKGFIERAGFHWRLKAFRNYFHCQ